MSHDDVSPDGLIWMVEGRELAVLEKTVPTISTLRPHIAPPAGLANGVSRNHQRILDEAPGISSIYITI
jgi:hypothetical protein